MAGDHNRPQGLTRLEYDNDAAAYNDDDDDDDDAAMKFCKTVEAQLHILLNMS
jgi:hypothetical protein